MTKKKSKRKPKPRQVPVSVVLLLVVVASVGSLTVGLLSHPVQTTYFTQTLTTLSTWTETGAETTQLWGRVCGNTPWNMTVLTAACQNEPVPEFPVAPLVAFAVLAASLILLRRRRR
jgi:ribose/xylose/arabinose/galactoside ABC-type transport system permease subunit